MKGLQANGGRDAPHDGKFGILQPLAESVILQAMEDLWSSRYREESIEFFQGSGFGLYAVIAGIGPSEKGVLLSIMIRALPGKRLKAAQPPSNNLSS
jgi:hypothetical protein